MLKSSIKMLIGTSALALSAQAYAVPVTLGAAADYNGFFFGDVNSAADSQGALAVGGNATLTGYTVNTLGQTNVTSLVVGGDLNQSGGDITGNAIVGGNYNSTNGGGIHSGTMTANAGSNVGIDFQQEYNNLSALSQNLYNAGATGTTDYSWGRIDLNGDGTIDQQIFNVTEDNIENFWGIYANEIEQGQEVIINVAGTNIDLNGGDYLLKDADWGWIGNSDSVLFNFYEAETINMSTSFEGSILAVNADITANGGQVNGQIIGGSLTGQVQLNQPLFSHNQEIVDVPEPSSIFILCAGIAGLIVQRRRMG